MEWKIDYLEKDKIVSAKIIGVMDWDQHKKFAQEVFAISRKNGSHKLLFDFLEMEPNFTILQVDDLPKLLKKIGIGPEFKIAAIHDPSSPKSSEHAFFKNVATIMLLHVKQFPDKDAALAWLKSEQ